MAAPVHAWFEDPGGEHLHRAGPVFSGSGKRIAVLGFAFKANTNDTPESPAIRICRDLLKEGAQHLIHDPKLSAAGLQVWRLGAG
jgi:UDP-N-acetyl-D-mannosaminuronate dehydrogenase